MNDSNSNISINGDWGRKKEIFISLKLLLIPVTGDQSYLSLFNYGKHAIVVLVVLIVINKFIQIKTHREMACFQQHIFIPK